MNHKPPPNPSLAEAERDVVEQHHEADRQDKLAEVRHVFQRFAHQTSLAVGSAWTFFLAIAIVVVWATTGPIFHFSDTWQLVINTGTTIVTFLMVFLIQNTQNRDAKAIHLKLDELIRSKRGARNTLVDLENCTDEELEEIESEFKRVRSRANRKKADHQADVTSTSR